MNPNATADPDTNLQLDPAPEPVHYRGRTYAAWMAALASGIASRGTPRYKGDWARRNAKARARRKQERRNKAEGRKARR